MADVNSFYCPKCKASSALSDRVSYDKNVDGLILSYSVAECNNCNFHFLVVRNRRDGKIIKVWPSTLPRAVDNKVPSPIKDDYEEALVCESAGAFRGASALARRTLQVICIDKGADKKKKLHEQIDELFEKGVITKDIKEWAHEVRFVGNDAAHPNDTQVTADDARDILELLDSMCDVLYIAPARAAERKIKRTRDADDEA